MQVPPQETHLPDLQDVIERLVATPTASAGTKWPASFDRATKELIIVPSMASNYSWLDLELYVRMIVKASEKAWWLFDTTGERKKEFVKWQEKTECPVAYAMRLE